MKAGERICKMDLSWRRVTPSTQPSLIPSIIQVPQHHRHNNQQIPEAEAEAKMDLHRQITLSQTTQIHAQFLKSHQNNLVPFNSFAPHLSPLARHNLLITSYNRNDKPIDALKLYVHMRNMGVEVDSFTVPSLLKSCGLLSRQRVGQEIHGFALKRRFDSDVFINNALIHMYSECGFLGLARTVFDKMLQSQRDAISWSTLIGSYSKYKMFSEALKIITEMIHLMVKPTESAMIGMANLFSHRGDGKMAASLQGYITKNSDHCARLGVNLTTSLIDMHAKCGNLAIAEHFFYGLAQRRSVVSWTAMIAGYMRCNAPRKVQCLFAEMVPAKVYPNEITLLSMMIQCGQVGDAGMAKQVHGYALRNGFHSSLQFSTALIDTCGKCGEVRLARTVFGHMEVRDVTAWTAVISACTRAGCVNEALDLFAKMRNAGIQPNKVTMVSLLSLCADAGALDLGRWIHTCVNKQSVEMEIDLILRTALVDMYAKCGDIDSAFRLFCEAGDVDICLWNALMTGLGMHGLANEALDLFSSLERFNAKPNGITFIGLLHACSHAGMVEEGKRVFCQMVDGYRMAPTIEHYGCMVDLLGRAGMLGEALEMIETMPMEPNVAVWGAFLGACKLHRNPTMGEMAARKLLEIDPENCGYNVLMSNIYASAQRWTDVSGVRSAMKQKRLSKEPGFSSIEVNGTVHEFLMGDNKVHPQSEKIKEMLAEMIMRLKEVGYKPDTSAVLLNLDDEEKEISLAHHSEKIAMAFGLISTKPGIPIRIVKNLRVCDDCHNASKMLSKIYGRVITVRDRNRFHHFRDGSCSCADYW